MTTTLIFQAILMGIIEGLTEFIPVSSTGHLILLGELLDFRGPPGKVFEIVIQLGAILAICCLYFRKIGTVVGGLASDPAQRRFVLTLIAAFLPAAVVGLAFGSFIKSVLFSPWVVAMSLIIGGILILMIERVRPPPAHFAADNLPVKTAFGIGCAQVIAMIPGVSRSGATIMGALMLRVDRVAATEFSFFLAIPTMFAATLYDLYKNREFLSSSDFGIIAVGFVTAFLAALLVVRVLVNFVSRHGFSVFAYYRIALGLVALGALYLRAH